MNLKQIRKILKDTDFVHTSGTPEELRVAEYLKECCAALGAEVSVETFAVPMSEMRSAHLYADGREIPCEGYRCCGGGEVEAELYYMPGDDELSLRGVRGKIVLLDTGVSHFLYQDLFSHGALGFITYDGNRFYADRDMDKKELRSYVACGNKLPGVNVNARDAFDLVQSGVRRVRLSVDEREYEGESHNVVAELPGEIDEWIVLTAHYDTTPLSRGSYDNMTGCIGLLNVLEALRGKRHRYGLRFVFCGSEERGLLGSKAYVAAHEEELEKIALNINLDMIGTVMGKFIACCSAEEALVTYLRYMGQELGWSIQAKQGVYSSDSTPFADKGVPSLSFARIAPPSQAVIHNRYDTAAVLSPQRIRDDSLFIAAFAGRMADAVRCPVGRAIPQKVRDELDVYLNRKRKE